MKIIDLGDVRYIFTDEYAQSVWSDGAICNAAFNIHHDEEDISRAKSLGYGDDVATMHKEHDLAHHLIMQALGWPSSVVLRCLAEGSEIPTGIGQMEERLALLLQHISNSGIMKVAEAVKQKG